MSKLKRRGYLVIKNIFLVLVVLTSLFPIYWTLVNSFRTNTQILSVFRLFPEQVGFENYDKIFRVDVLPTAFMNSVVITGTTMALTALLTMMAAYALSCYRFKLGGWIYSLFAAGIFIPSATTMGMIYKLLQSMQLLGKRSGIVLLYTAGRIPLSIFLLVAFMKAIPDSVKEAAVIDGANIFQQIKAVEWPAIKDVVIIQFIMSAGNIMSIGFEKAYALQTDLNMKTSEIISTYVYKKGLLDGDYGFSTAVGLFNTVINLILLVTVNKVVARMNEGKGL